MITNDEFDGKSNTKGFGMIGPDKTTSTPGVNRFIGLNNYTVSINFNRPQQSKGVRPKRSGGGRGNGRKPQGVKQHTNNFFRNGPAFDSPHQKKPNQDNIYDYDIETDANPIQTGGFIDIESSTRKRPSKTAAGKKRNVVSLNSVNRYFSQLSQILSFI